MARRRAAGRERRLASRHAARTTSRPWRRAGAEARSLARSIARLAVPLAMAGVAATQAPDKASAVGEEVVQRQTSKTEAEGPPLEGGGQPSLLPLRRSSIRHHLFRQLVTPSSNLLPHPLHRHQRFWRSGRRPHHLRPEIGREPNRRWRKVGLHSHQIPRCSSLLSPHLRPDAGRDPIQWRRQQGRGGRPIPGLNFLPPHTL
jgi:hypothetical protein